MWHSADADANAWRTDFLRHREHVRGCGYAVETQGVAKEVVDLTCSLILNNPCIAGKFYPVRGTTVHYIVPFDTPPISSVENDAKSSWLPDGYLSAEVACDLRQLLQRPSKAWTQIRRSRTKLPTRYSSIAGSSAYRFNYYDERCSSRARTNPNKRYSVDET
jgi:hypothetical protein